MRIALISDCYLPTKNGVVTSLLGLVGELRRRGHYVVLITVAPGGLRAGFRGFGGFHEARDCRDYPEYRETAGAQGASVMYCFPQLPLLPSIRIGLGLAGRGRMRRILQGEGVDLIHTHTEFLLARAARRAAAALGLPAVHTLHTTYEQYRHYLPPLRLLPLAGLRWWWKGVLSGYRAVICPGEPALRHAQRCGVGELAAPIPNGTPLPCSYDAPLDPGASVALAEGAGAVETDRDEPAGEERTIPRPGPICRPPRRVLLYCGRLAREKRTGVLIDEILPVLERHPDYRLIIVGDGPDRRRLQQRLRGRRVDRQVRFTGYLDRRETLRWYRAAELFVTASLSENHPMSLIEAQAAGLPVVARRDPGIGTAVRPGQSALLADTDGELGSLCERLLEDAELHRSMSREAERAAESFDIRRHGDRVEALYGRLLSEAH